jgi:hypothetical protein
MNNVFGEMQKEANRTYFNVVLQNLGTNVLSSLIKIRRVPLTKISNGHQSGVTYTAQLYLSPNTNL